MALSVAGGDSTSGAAPEVVTSGPLRLSGGPIAAAYDPQPATRSHSLTDRTRPAWGGAPTCLGAGTDGRADAEELQQALGHHDVLGAEGDHLDPGALQLAAAPAVPDGRLGQAERAAELDTPAQVLAGSPWRDELAGEAWLNGAMADAMADAAGAVSVPGGETP
jgi:hypothetical protein